MLVDAGLSSGSPRHTVQRTWYDTFDWRLWRRQRTLLGAALDDHMQLSYGKLAGPRHRARTNAPAAARFAHDLPPGALRDALTPVTKVRALLPQVTVGGRSESLLLRNREQKVVLRLALEELEVAVPDSDTRRRLQCVQLEPVRGYPRALRRIQRLLQDEGLQPLPGGLLAHTLELLGIDADRPAGKPVLTLAPDMRADAATRALLLELLRIMRHNESGVIADLDSEFLHDFRIAVRQSRTLLGMMKQVFTRRDVQRFRSRLAWLGQITSPTRDMDVYLLKFPGYQDSLPAAVRPDLEPLREFLQRQQQREQARLAKALRSSRYATLVGNWEEFLRAPGPINTRLANATRPVLEVASERIRRTWRSVLRHGRAIDDASPAEALHDLRKRCKKLRYLLELFRSLYPARPIARLIKELKQLQDVLGDFQDLHVQIGSLAQFTRQMRDEGALNPRCADAIGLLIDDLGQRQEDCRNGFEAHFARFARKQNRQIVKRLFPNTGSIKP